MKPHIAAYLFFIFILACNGNYNTEMASSETNSTQDNPKVDYGPITLVIHGGAGNIKKENISDEQEAAYQTKLEEALNVGYAVLEGGGSSMDAVVASIEILESSPLFNAGVGAVFTNEGKNELDASIMDGNTMQAGAVAGITTVKSPIKAARAVMDKSPHVMMAGAGAEKFAKEQGLEIVDPSYFKTDRRWQQLEKAREKEKLTSKIEILPDFKFGTVGCVALDKNGNIAAGTSTGGMTNKRYGRIGDSPIIGAGTYADNNSCGVSSTGHGEYFIRNVVAYDISVLMKYKNLSLEDAANEVIMKKLVDQGGDGGIIALDRMGNIAMPFNSEGMFRGYINEKGNPRVYMFKNTK